MCSYMRVGARQMAYSSLTGGDRGGVLAGDPNGADAPGPISLQTAMNQRRDTQQKTKNKQANEQMMVIIGKVLLNLAQEAAEGAQQKVPRE